MINKADIYAAFGKTVPQETPVEEAIVDPFVDDIKEEYTDESEVYPTPTEEASQITEPYIYEEVSEDMLPTQDYRHYGFLRTTIVLAIIVLAFALSAEQQNIIHLMFQNIVLYPWYPLVIIGLALGLLWYKSWIGKAVGGCIILLVVATASYFELYDSLAINDPVQTSRSQSLHLSGVNTLSVQIDDIVSNMIVNKGNNNVVDVTQSGERSLGLVAQAGTIVLSGANTWNIVTRPESSISLSLPANKNLSIASKQMRADNIWDLRNLRISSLRTLGGVLNQDIIVPTLGSLQYLTIQSRWSDINLYVPNDIGVEIQLDNRIDTKELADLEQIDTDLYRSKNFAQTDTHLRIRVDSVFSSFTLHRD